MTHKQKIVILVVFALVIGFFTGDKYARYSIHQKAVENEKLQGEIIQRDAWATQDSVTGVQSAEVSTEEDVNEKVNLNTADKEQLMTLEGIGEVKAEEILLYREKYGSFVSIEELMNIDGIGEKTFEKNKNRLCVE